MYIYICIYHDIYIYVYMDCSQNYGNFLGGPYNKNCGILRPILGSPYLRKLLFTHTYIYIYTYIDICI